MTRRMRPFDRASNILKHSPRASCHGSGGINLKRHVHTALRRITKPLCHSQSCSVCTLWPPSRRVAVKPIVCYYIAPPVFFRCGRAPCPVFYAVARDVPSLLSTRLLTHSAMLVSPDDSTASQSLALPLPALGSSDAPTPSLPLSQRVGGR